MNIFTNPVIWCWMGRQQKFYTQALDTTKVIKKILSLKWDPIIYISVTSFHNLPHGKLNKWLNIAVMPKGYCQCIVLIWLNSMHVSLINPSTSSESSTHTKYDVYFIKSWIINHECNKFRRASPNCTIVCRK